jgi:hypothetical protein
MLDHESLVPDLLAAIPEFRPQYEEHLRDYGEVLSYVLLDEFYRFIVDLHHRTRRATEDSKQLEQIITRSTEFLERAVDSTDDELVSLMYSFLQNLDPRGSDYQEVASFLLQRPKLSAAFRNYFLKDG